MFWGLIKQERERDVYMERFLANFPEELTGRSSHTSKAPTHIV